ncbi:unnamed protein product [Cuscuta epithymum]|uniref:Uncharacterized protein n=1 Tax=Cuscuta epithymum TaxID=186058 RepID=A0AAV0CSD3_9ASTE|nr:unnamed protein product [Cuscuta epithymum]
MFFLCPFTCRVWERVQAWIGVGHQMTTLLGAIKWISKMHKGATVKAKAGRLAFCATTYYIWQARNETRFDEGKKTEEDVVAKIKHVVYKILFSIYPHDLIKF